MIHRVTVLAHDGLAPFELGVAAEVFALPRPELDVDWWYEFSVCAERPGTLAAVGGFGLAVERGLAELERADTIVLPGTPDVHGIPSRAARGRPGRRARARGAARLDLLGRVRAGRDRPARRPPRGDPLALRRPARPPLPARARDPGRALRRRAGHPHVGRDGGRDRPLPAPRARRPRRRRGQPGRAPDGRARPPRRRPGPVHRPPGARPPGRRPGRRGDGVGARPPARPHRRRRPGAPRAPVAAAVQPPLPRRDRREPGAWLLRRRLDAALPLLESSDEPVEHVAARVGFPTPAAFRRHFTRAYGLAPSAWRRNFAAR